MTKPQGHTLVELLVSLAILAILLSTAAPALSSMAESNKTTSAVNQMLGAIQYTRSSAVISHQQAILCPGQTACTNTSDWSDSVLIFQDRNGNERLDQDEPQLRHERLPDGYAWNWSSFRKLPHIIYQQDGTTQAANGTLTLCKKGKPLQQIVISLAGRVRQQTASSSALCH